jgi:hypothetical protein
MSCLFTITVCRFLYQTQSWVKTCHEGVNIANTDPVYFVVELGQV